MGDIVREPVQSSNLVSVGYDPVDSILEVEFKGGSVYHYLGVPRDVARELMEAPSPGRYLNEVIKPTYAYMKV